MSARFVECSYKGFSVVADALFASLRSEEALSLVFSAEETDFIRFNKARIRQTTHVQQAELEMQLQDRGKTIHLRWSLALRPKDDISLSLLNLGRARQLLEKLPPDPFQVKIRNNGESSSDIVGDYPKSAELTRYVAGTAAGSDFVGLVCAGSVISANRNSLGQSHWFSTDSFFVDYSLFLDDRSVKGCYSGTKWSDFEWKKSFEDSKAKLSLMNKPLKVVEPGAYRLYLAPAAVSEILGHFEWGVLSQKAFQQGTSPFLKLARSEVRLSPLLSLRENFDLHLCPKFNSRGEVSASQVDLISQGNFIRFLTNTKSSLEFSVPSNGANDSESLRSPEILPGTLTQEEILPQLETGLYISNFHYLAWSDHLSARLTGMTRFGCFSVEAGQIVGPIQNMRFDESVYDLWGKSLLALTDFQETDPAVGTYFRRSLGGRKIPGMLISSAQFTL
ncbi:MAG: Zn-dependent protease [Bdellovibrionaceae bacterium]|nr:Zn-dependent protease [Pseudobdellovibrionaceae bacterium]